jgi:N-acetylneuraminate synthase
MEISGRSIGHDEPVYFIAEAGINHNGSFQIAKDLIDLAADAEADAVKFQKRVLKETYVEDIVEDPAIAEMGVEYTVSNLIDVELTDTEFRKLADYAKEQSIEFLCSPWDVESVEFLESLDIPAYKIGSPDMTNFVLLERIIETGKPVFLSTGMANEDEIDRTVDFLVDRDADFALLHCRSTYPAPFHNLNMQFMKKMIGQYDVPIGYSGHERGISVSIAAAAKGACILERHFTLDRTMEGPDHAASLAPPGIKRLIRDIRKVEESQGTDVRYMTRGEYNNRVALGKSLVATEPIQSGETVDREQLTAKSPAKGISPQHLYDVVGRESITDIDADRILKWEHFDSKVLETYDIDLEGWGVVVRFSDITAHDWGDPDVFEFRVNGADIEADIEEELAGKQFEKRLGVHAPEQKGHEIVDLSAEDESKRKRAVNVLQDVIDITRKVIAPHFETSYDPQIVIHPGGITRDRMVPDKIPAMNEALERSMDELHDAGVRLLLENMPPLPWIYGGQQYHNNFMDADEIAGYCERTGQRICYDTSHAKLWCNYGGKDLVEHAKTLRPYIEYLHVADAAGVDGEGLQIGDGEIDFDRLAPVFEDFQGPVVTEIWRGHENRGEGFKKAATRLGELF